VSLQHVALETRVGDVEAEVAFWGLLGFARVEPPPTLRERSTWVQAGDGAQIHLLYVSDPVAVPRGHVAVVAPAFDATIALLEGAGHETEARTPHWGAARAYVRSPGGHLIEVMAAPSPAGGASGAPVSEFSDR
jgi:catechol 2,3-dioxygenase-like lactoylglutathione lyase family enzyme